MFRTLAIVAGLVVAASAVSAEEFLVHVNDVGNEAGANTVAVAAPSGSSIVDGSLGFDDLPEAVQAALANARGEAVTTLGDSPFN